MGGQRPSRAGAPDLTAGPLTLYGRVWGLRLGAGMPKALLVPLGPQWVVGRTEPQAQGQSLGRRAAPEPCGGVPVPPSPNRGSRCPRGGSGQAAPPEATGSAPLQEQDTRRVHPSLPGPVTPAGALELSALHVGCPWSPPGLAGGPSEGRTRVLSSSQKLLTRNHELHFFGN